VVHSVADCDANGSESIPYAAAPQASKVAMECAHKQDCECQSLTKALDLVAVVAFLERVNKEYEAECEHHEAAERVVLDQDNVCKAVFFKTNPRIMQKLRLHP
jgi:hypothetical protein